jgi:hypothetical protein
MVLTASVFEFGSIPKAKAWIAEVRKTAPGDPAGFRATDAPEIGEDGICVAQSAGLACYARKANFVIGINVRGSSTPFRGFPAFQPTPELLSRSKEAAKRAVRKL